MGRLLKQNPYIYTVIQSIAIEEFLQNPQPLIDVRSPGEYLKGHIPGAVNVPLFSNEERAEIGTAYVQRSKDEAMELGYTYANPKKQFFIDECRKIAGGGPLTLYCWRGGLRSRLFTEHLHENGFENLSLIQGGYKAWRRLLIAFWEKPHNIQIIGGYTGSGKTLIIKNLIELGHQTIDLEGLACHKGSAFGSIGQKEQPSTEDFENRLFDLWRRFDPAKPVWLEDESRNIGKVFLPDAVYSQMKTAPVYFLDIPREKRAEYLVKDYSDASLDELKESIIKISKRFGPENTYLSIQWLNEGKLYEVAYLALGYYDKSYKRVLNNHNNVVFIKESDINIDKITEDILSKYDEK
ncbi:MAG: tRNA 2-selenouridine(34) synthase MnmH [Bacteroidales bacterium]|nr:tRNA 2-selenouridine(34) synthase MnmH [Bacteroidales bacterium]